MKAINYLTALTVVIFTAFVPATAQDDLLTDSTGLPGDNFSLQGALEMFKKAGSPEEFENLINREDNNVNNLDINGDGETDYIRVIDKMDKDLHAFILQVPVSKIESQDIAVIEMEKTGDTSVVLQIIGDEDIFGEEIIVEPGGGSDDKAYIEYKNNRIQSGSYSFYYYTVPARIVVNVWLWPSVRFVYAPVYRPWISPWRWRHHPGWWRPWKPLGWHVWHPRKVHFQSHYAVVHTHRVVRAHAIYRPARIHSVAVRNRHATAIGNYRVNRSRTSVTGPRGNKVTRQTKILHGPRGKVKASKTTVKRKR